MQDYFQHILNLLKQDERFFSIDGNFLRNAATQAAFQGDSNLIKILIADNYAAQNFFNDIDGFKVFDAKKFSYALNNYEFLPGSFTRFKNHIGIADSNENFISQSSNVELLFPYKDCVLEGGQTKDEQKRPEIFFNETLARADIDALLEPKVFTCAKKFSTDGVSPAETFSPNDNLIIKGNNLLALASIIPRFKNKIKCIYIDVPYNTGNDSFNYNDRFNHSSWLTFMKTRLQFAQKLLRNDGSIWISIDDNEQAYLKILCDEIFGRDNFLATVIWERAYAPVNLKKNFSQSHDYILVAISVKRLAAY